MAFIEAEPSPENLPFAINIIQPLPDAGHFALEVGFKNIELDEHGETSSQKDSYGIVFSFNNNGEIQWIHRPKKNGLSAKGKSHLVADGAAIGYVNAKESLTRILDLEGKTVWEDERALPWQQMRYTAGIHWSQEMVFVMEFAESGGPLIVCIGSFCIRRPKGGFIFCRRR